MNSNSINNNNSSLNSSNQQHQQINTFLSSTLLKLQSRLDNLQIKLMSLNKVVRLLQHYTQKKDQLQQKQASNMANMRHKFIELGQLHKQMSQSLQICNELKSHLKMQTLKIQQATKHIDNHKILLKQKDELLYQTQLRLNDELNLIKDKINKIQSNFLLQIRKSTKNNQIQKYDFNLSKIAGGEDKMIIEDINSRIDKLENRLRVEMEAMKIRNDKIMKMVRRVTEADQNDYGLKGEKRNSISKHNLNRKESLNLKRLKSK